MKLKIIFFIFLFLITSCQKQEKQQNTNFSKIEIWQLDIPTKQKEIAKVNNIKIYKEDIQQYELSSKLALNKIIEDSLLLSEFLKTTNKQEISNLLKAQAITFLLKNDFEKNYALKNLTDQKLREIYNEIQSPKFSRIFQTYKFIFSHKEWRVVKQLVIPIKKNTDKDEISSAKAMLRLIKSRLEIEKPINIKNFRNMGWIILKSYFKVRYENKIPPLSLKPNENFFRYGRQFDGFFIDEIFKITKKGELSAIFNTNRGVHLTYLINIIPETHETFKQVKVDLKKKLEDAYRTKNFSEWLNNLRKKYKAAIYIKNFTKYVRDKK